MLKIKNKSKLAIAVSIVIVVIVCISILTMVLVQNKPEEGLQVSASDDGLMQEDEGILDVEEIVTEENVQEHYDEEVIEPEQPSEVVEEKPKENTATNTTNKKQNKQTTTAQTADIPYFIRINYEQNVVTIYAKDENGNYTKPIKAMVCSCGTATPTSGTYSISSKYKWGKLFGGVSGQYCTRIVKSILFHSVPYLTHEDAGSLEYWEYDKLGTTASAGCIRLTVADAKWIYSNCAKGTKVEFYADSNPGPLGKPTAQKISSEEAVRGWDPTDPALENPWKTYNKKEEATKVENKVEQNEVVSNVVKPENTVVQNQVVNNVVKPENTVVQNQVVDNTVKSENKVVQNQVVNNVVKPENNVTQNQVVNNTVKSENKVVQNQVVNNVMKPENTVTQNQVVNNVVKPENKVTQNQVVNNTVKPENNIIKNQVTSSTKENNAITKNEIKANIVNNI